MRVEEREVVTFSIELTRDEAISMREALHGVVPEVCNAPEGPLRDLCESLFGAGVLVGLG